MKKHVNLIRNLLYIFVIVTIFALQSIEFFPKIYFYNYNLLPTIIISIAIVSNIPVSVAYAFFISILCDINYTSVEGLNTIFFITASIIIAYVAKKYFTKSFITNMMFVSITLLIYEIFQFIFYYLTISKEFLLLFFQISCAEILISTILCPIPYAFFKFFENILKEDS